jgi:hypothetical protein
LAASQRPHPEERALAALLRCRYARLEGWPRVRALHSSFETHRFAMLLRMRLHSLRRCFRPVSKLHPEPPAPKPALHTDHEHGILAVGFRVHGEERPFGHVSKPHPEERASVALLRCRYARLEGWPRIRALHPIGIGGSLATPPLPHHRTYGSHIRRFDRLSTVGISRRAGELDSGVRRDGFGPFRTAR